MRLFTIPDGVVDRFDRAAWLTMPFERSWDIPMPAAQPPYRVVASGSFRSGTVAGGGFHSGADEAGSFHSGAVIGQGSS